MLSRRSVLPAACIAGATAIGDHGGIADTVSSESLIFDVPPNACDAHQHIIGDPAIFPMSPTRSYTPPQAPLVELQAMHARLHIKRAVLVQPSFYGTDNSCLLNALKQLGTSGRGVAVIDDNTSENELDEMGRLGVRGVRINGTGSTRDPDSLRRVILEASRRVESRGWHIQTFLPLATIENLGDKLASLPTPIVFDHFAGASAAGISQPGFAFLCDLISRGNCYIKLSAPYHASKRPVDYADMLPLAQVLIKTREDRILWGSDWPHTDSEPKPGIATKDISPFYPVNDLTIFNALATWAPNEALRNRILVDNPKSLFEF